MLYNKFAEISDRLVATFRVKHKFAANNREKNLKNKLNLVKCKKLNSIFYKKKYFFIIKYK